MKERLQKVLARVGLGSRRQIEKWIEQGLIKVNGHTAKLGDCVSSADNVSVEGKTVELLSITEQKTRILLYNKSEGEICSRDDPEGRPTIFENLPLLRNGRWISVGRLDINTQGLLILTNNGEIAHHLMHPKFNIEREYAVRVFGDVTPEHIKLLTKGVVLDDGLAKFDKVIDAGGEGINHWFHVIIGEGRQREVRRLWESQGLKVSRLIRVRYGKITLPKDLRRGRWEELETEQVKQFMQLIGLEKLAKSKKPDSKLTLKVKR